jgi:two-component system phosphate regulon sensor histidine kinase PhoR
MKRIIYIAAGTLAAATIFAVISGALSAACGNAAAAATAFCAAAACIGAFAIIKVQFNAAKDKTEAERALRRLAGSTDDVQTDERADELEQMVNERIGRLVSDRRRILYMLDNMSEGLVMLEKDLTITLINKSAMRFFDVDESVRGRNLLRLVHMPRMIDAAQQAVGAGTHSAFDIRMADGERVLQAIVSPAGSRTAAGGGAIVLITDVTAVRRAEQIRSDFVANASHELKTPLTSIKGFAELMESGIISDPQQSAKCLEHIRKETDRMIGLIDDILKLSELESVVSDTGRSRVGLKLIAQRAADSLDIQAREKGVSVDVTGSTGMLSANPDRMFEVVLNLVDNAIKYNRPGGKVGVDISETDSEVTLRVADTGVGIPEESKERIFERFYRVDKSRSRREGGTGLGLAIVKHITELYKGHITLDSKLGEGTTVTVVLPRAL